MQEPSPQVDDWAHRVIGAAIEVHRTLGPGFLESAYEEALAIEFGLRGIPFERQKLITLEYKSRTVGESRLDFLVGGQLIIELKAVETIHPIHSAQLINYLKMTDFQLGLIINFHVLRLRDGIKRIVLSSV